MITNIIFKIDETLKNKAMQKAEDEGVSLSSVLQLATKAFANGDLKVSLVGSEAFNAISRKEIKNALKDVAERKNISSRLDSAKKAIDYLNK
jgi:antitoxin component of RelBE/YafQ-DinJ toxin-antitoxin module